MLRKEFKPAREAELDGSEEDFNEEDLDIVLNEVEPDFLKGQTSKTGVYLNPVRLVRDQEGSLQREAIAAQQLARERRTQKDEATRAIIESLEGDFNKISDDPVSFGEPILMGHLKAVANKESRTGQAEAMVAKVY
jgi:ATP-dependent RNA helicase DHX8/PRP22